MENNDIVDKNIPYIVFESTVARFDRVIKRLWIVILILVFLLLGTNLAWLYYESQYEVIDTTTTQTVTQDTEEGGTNSFIGGDNYGTTDDKDSKADAKKKTQGR